MDYVQFLTIMATMFAGFGFIYREFKVSQADLKNDLQRFESEIREDIKIQSNRSDQLYTMFIDLIKVRKDTPNP